VNVGFTTVVSTRIRRPLTTPRSRAIFISRGPTAKPQRLHGLGIRHLPGAHLGEVAVNQIGADFALEDLVAPVSHMLENEQAEDHFGWRRHDLFIPQNLSCVIHSSRRSLTSFGDQTLTEGC
jgi:hypothetical protein